MKLQHSVLTSLRVLVLGKNKPAFFWHCLEPLNGSQIHCCWFVYSQLSDSDSSFLENWNLRQDNEYLSTSMLAQSWKYDGHGINIRIVRYSKIVSTVDSLQCIHKQKYIRLVMRAFHIISCSWLWNDRCWNRMFQDSLILFTWVTCHQVDHPEGDLICCGWSATMRSLPNCSIRGHVVSS